MSEIISHAHRVERLCIGEKGEPMLTCVEIWQSESEGHGDGISLRTPYHPLVFRSEEELDDFIELLWRAKRRWKEIWSKR